MDGIFEKVVDEMHAQGCFALCIVTGTKGSTPRAVGAKMLVFPDGGIFGTIGGGRVEKKVISDALDVLKQRRAAAFHYDLLRELQMCCGGSMDIYIEPVMPKNKLYIFGAGHTGAALAATAVDLGFEITVVDDRQDYLDSLDIEGIKKRHGDYVEVLPSLAFDEQTYITIMTYSHPIDRKILALCLRKPHAYVGMIGSMRKVEVTKRLFEEEGIGSVEELEEVDMPMGIDIGADGPEEIAVSILAKLIAVKNKKLSK